MRICTVPPVPLVTVLMEAAIYPPSLVSMSRYLILRIVILPPGSRMRTGMLLSMMGDRCGDLTE